MPGPTPDAGGYTCQVCGGTYATQQQLIEHGREQHPGKPVTWGDPIESTVSSEREYDTTGRVESEVKSDIGGVGDKVKDGAEAVGSKVTSNVESIGDKMKAGAKAIGSKVKDPDKDLETEYQKKKGES
jgi:hypothetical protein